MLNHISKRTISVISVIVLIVCVFTAYIVRTNNSIPKLFIAQTGSHEEFAEAVRLDISDNITQETAPVYRIKPKDVAADKQKLKDLFIGSSHDIELSNTPTYIKEGDKGATSFTFDDKTGFWTYNTDISYYTGENVPSEDEAIRIANAFMHDYELYPIDQIGEPRVSPLTSGDGIFEETKVLAWDIYYYPKVNGKTVYGVFRIMISVGSDGEIVGVNKLAGEFEFVQDVPLKQNAELYEDFSSGDFAFTGEVLYTDTVLTEKEVIYYVESTGQYIQPVYKISDTESGAEIIIDAHRR